MKPVKSEEKVITKEIKEDNKKILTKQDRDEADELVKQINGTISKGDDSNSIIVVDHVDGSILTLDTQKFPSRMRNSNVEEEKSSMDETSPTRMASPSNAQLCDNLDTISETSSTASTSSGCCSANSSGSSPTPPNSSTSHEMCSPPTSPSPDSLDSTPDSYDLIKADLKDSLEAEDISSQGMSL